ncbi:Hypothetical predicted protein [Paramuricea clavata]|uniref:Uncharacterized protein n=1 Tax=Paramuricea clavata TaxID=317549 RepID=A0A6S7KZ93_PARCT|nr:Hypothetical predicted protein [Paramuricea clavata]
MATEISRETRSRSEARKEFDSYVQSEAFVSLLDDAISKQFEKFFSSEDLKKMLVATTTSVVSTVVKESVHASLDEVIWENVMPLKKQIEELEDENCYEVVTEFCKTKLGYNLELCEINRTHRVGRLRPGKQRAIIVKFCSYQSKIKVMKCKKNLKGTSIYVNEDLTFFNKELFNYAHTNLKDLPVWSTDGKVLIKQQSGCIVRAKTKDDVNGLRDN